MRRTHRFLLITILSVLVLMLVAWPLLVRWIDRLHGNVPIVFYGHIVDEQGKGIAEIEVTGEVSSVRWFTALTIYNVQYNRSLLSTRTDDDGKFSFSSHGNSLHLQEIKAPGMRVVSNTRGAYQYPPDPEYPLGWNPRPDDPDKPIVITMSSFTPRLQSPS